MKSAERISCVGGARRHVIPVTLALAVVLLLGVSTAMSADWPQFRGPNRDGKSPDTGLLKEWPPGGPKLLWAVEDLGHGFSSVAVADGMLYTTGLEGKTGYLYACDLDGNPKWKKPYGPGWTGEHPGTRSTPTVDAGLVYVMSGHGRVVCFDARTGEEQGAVDTMERFGARQITWGIAESLLVVGDKLICTPGGQNAGVVALNKKTGETIWVCEELSDASAYCAPILVQRGNRQIVVTLTANGLVGIDATTGKLLWKHGRKVNYDIHAVSPVYEDGRIYVTSGYGGAKGEMLELSEDGTSISRRWTDSKLDCHHGGVIVHNGYIYGASHNNARGNWICLNLKTGQVAAEIAGVGNGSIAYADGMIYGYGQGGTVGLMKPSPDDFRLVSSFKVSKGSKEHWAHPAIANGRLYIRHGNALMAYDIQAK